MGNAFQSAEQLIPAVEHLSLPELEHFTSLVLQVRARKLMPSLSPTETRLLQQINHPDNLHWRERLHFLNKRLEEETLTEDEHNELISLVEAEEEWQATRLKLLLELASIRQVGLNELMSQLGILTKQS